MIVRTTLRITMQTTKTIIIVIVIIPIIMKMEDQQQIVLIQEMLGCSQEDGIEWELIRVISKLLSKLELFVIF